jgi:16S rRNA (uracil1498-N3)-methyltransferase
VNIIGVFYLPSAEWQEPFRLSGAEGSHLVKVLRARVGDRVRLLDGQGREGLFTISELGKQHTTLRPEEIVEHPRPQGGAVLALGWVKSLRRSWLLEKAVELEAREVWFWQARRSQVLIPDEGKEAWRSQLIAGAKQCRNPWLPDIRVMPGGISELVAAAKDFKHCFMLHEDHNQGQFFDIFQISQKDSPLFILGPEGGFTLEETEAMLAADIVPISLGQRVLRWETAALLCLGLAWWNRERA